MSLKPKKKSDLKKIQEKMTQEQQRIEFQNQLPPYTMIVSEGIKTEPLYLKGFVKKINDKYKGIIREPRIVVYGTGRNTCGILKFIDRKIKDGTWEKYTSFWLVYDKDDFPYDNFDNTQFSVEARTNKRFRVAWSNESIELWFLLHFQDYSSDNGRKQYIEKLETLMGYTKTREDLYDVLMEKGSLVDAKRRAKKLYDEALKRGITSPSAMVPATRIYELIEELETYI